MNTRMNRLLSEIKTEVGGDGFTEAVDDNFEALTEAQLAEQPKDPKARALFRMDAAARRAGLDGMIKALTKRVKATKDPGKRQGIVDAMDELIKTLTQVKKSAA